jgi:hypothetical protein
MKIKLIQIYDMEEPLKKVMKQDVPIKIAYKLAKNIKKINDEYMIIVNQKNNLIKKYGKESEGVISVLQENINKYTEEFSEYLNTEIELDIDKINISELGNSIKISTMDIIALDLILEEE